MVFLGQECLDVLDTKSNNTFVSSVVILFTEYKIMTE